ncbi:homeobox protein caupolican isoform X2 [Calliphora vicina]
MLKEWLVRRRENPYPSREEKKRLAIETGLTYTQICNWFANWRRKLKNSEREKSKKSWGHLIKHYNNNAKGNVEQFSISSEDSIWEEEEQQRRLRMNERALKDDDYDDEDDEDSSLCDIEGSNESTDMERNGSCGSGETQIMDTNYQPNYYMDTRNMSKDPVELFIGREVDVLTTTATCQVTGGSSSSDSATKTKYKQKMMEKYLRDTTNDSMQINSNLNIQPLGEQHEQMPTTYVNGNNTTIIKSGAELSKWLESAAKFTPNKNNYYIEWNSKRNKLEKKPILTKTYLPATHSVNLQNSNTTVTMLPLLYSTTPLVQRDNSQDHHRNQLHHHNLHQQHIYDVIHHKDELDAAEALANLAFNCRQKMLDSATNGRNTLSWPINAISS